MGLHRGDGARRLAGVSGVLAQRARREAEARLAGQPRRLAHVRGVVESAERLGRYFDAQTAQCLHCMFCHIDTDHPCRDPTDPDGVKDAVQWDAHTLGIGLVKTGSNH